jgi:hypothetical protein
MKALSDLAKNALLTVYKNIIDESKLGSYSIF